MNFAGSLFRFYILGSIHVSAAVTCLAGVTFLEFGYPLDMDLLLFIFLGSIIGYNFVKYAGVANLHHINNTPNIRLIRWFTVLSVPAAIYFGMRLSISVIIAGGVLAGLTFFYALPLYNGNNLRSLKGIKVFVIAFVWAGVTVVLPLADHEPIFSAAVIAQFMAHLLFVVVLMLPFDIRDLKYDYPNLKTIPQQFGVKGAKWFGASFLGVMIAFKTLNFGISGSEIAVTLLIGLLTGILLVRSRRHPPAFYASFGVEGVPILWFLLLWVIQQWL